MSRDYERYPMSIHEKITSTILGILAIFVLAFCIWGAWQAAHYATKPESHPTVPYCDTMPARDDPRCAGWFTQHCYH